MQTILAEHWHHLPCNQVVELFDTNREHGLDGYEAESRRKRFGPNVLPQRRAKGPVLRFLLQFHQPLVYILLLASGITAVLKEWTDAAVIFGVVLLNAVIGFVQEAKAARALGALAKSMTTMATVLRGGRTTQLDSAELVPGDVVLLQSGDKVPADLRLIDCKDLQIDESALTGESLAVEKRATTLEKDVLLAERSNMAYSSTLVTYGQARGVVVATGADTEVGKISHLIETADNIETPLTKKIGQFSHLLVYVILGFALATFAVGVYRGQPVVEMFMASVALVVGAIPEGLPAAVTIILAIGVHRMAQRRAIIRKLPAVETLGSTTVVCSDKTGTLTENAMTVVSIWTGGQHYSVTGTGYNPSGDIHCNDTSASLHHHPSLHACLISGLVCNDSQLNRQGDHWHLQGDPTEGALVVAATKAGLDAAEERRRFRRIDVVPFESEHQYMATLHDDQTAETRTLFVKGAVEKIVARCDAMLDATGEPVPLDATRIHAEFERMADQGLRVLAFAKHRLPINHIALRHTDLESGLTFVGLQGMIDPPRQAAIQAVATCQRAGVQVKMITGDHALTARAIAMKLGILKDGDQQGPMVATGADLARLNDEELIEAANRLSVFARVTPQQKLRLVWALQKRRHIVAMTGDGVNDAPALAQADIGVAMGITGTEVAKEAADMVLTDDNFASIEASIEEGRGVFDNLTKFILWTLPTNVGEGLVILAATFAGVTLPILPVQILWINMTTAVLLGLTLAFEPKEPSIMSRAPRVADTPILTGALLFRITLVGFLLLAGAFGLFEWTLAAGYSESTARTVTVNVFVFVQMFYLMNCRSLTRSIFHVGLFTNAWVWFGIGAMTLLQLLYTYHPAMHHVFQSAPIDSMHWRMIFAVATLAFLVVGAEKWVRRQFAIVPQPSPACDGDGPTRASLTPRLNGKLT